MKLEIAVFNPESALIAYEAGADRIELCSAPAEGGLTPSLGVMLLVRKKIDIPIFAMIRPREGDFYYSELEFEIMLRDIESAKSAGMDGIVAGVLKKDGSVDKVRTSLLVEAAYPLSFTFHRAFDKSSILFDSLETIIKCGCERVLTSGGKNKASAAIETLIELQNSANQRIIILPGSGIGIENVMQFKQAGFSEVHCSARTLFESLMLYRKDEPILGGNSYTPDYSIIQPDKHIIEAIIKAISN